MQKTTEVRKAGAHRKTDNAAKRRMAMVAVAASAVTSAGAAGATAGAQQANADDVSLASNTTLLAQGAEGSAAPQAAEAQAPQILEVPQNAPIAELSDQLSSALRFAQAREAADLLARAPLAAKPAEGSYTSPFSMRWGTMHNGIDLANGIGTPILAAMDGIVIDSGTASGFGNWIRIRHNDGTVTVYGHMATLDVAVGQHVTAGQKIAGMGNEGYSTGSHLHFEVHPAGGGAIDPVPWLQERGITIQ